MTQPKPYYDDGKGIVIYNADAREVLPLLEPGSVDLVLTDPPYGINLPTDYASRKRGVCRIDYIPIFGDGKPFVPAELLALDTQMILWGG